MKTIVESHATGAEIGAIVGRIEPVVQGAPQGHVLIALLSMCLVYLKPTINPDELQEAIAETSRFMCLYLNDDDDDFMDAPDSILVDGNKTLN